MDGQVTKDEMEQIFENRKRAQFELLQIAKKLTFNFYVDAGEKGRFLQLVSMLSVVEFMIDVDLDHIWIRKSSNDKLIFVIRASGTKENLDRWKDNLDQVASFLNGDRDITYFKNINEQKD
jgi:hypothetical protein